MLKMPRMCSVGMPKRYPVSIKNSDLSSNFLSPPITESFIFYKNSALDFGWLDRIFPKPPMQNKFP